MILLATLKIALLALRRNKMRTLLTMLGIIIGVGAVIAVVSIGSGAKAQVEAQIASMGQNVVLILSGNVSRGGFRMGFGTAKSHAKPAARHIARKDENHILAHAGDLRFDLRFGSAADADNGNYRSNADNYAEHGQ